MSELPAKKSIYTSIAHEVGASHLVWYPQFNDIINKVERCRKLTQQTGIPHCACIDAPTGGGKSAILQALAAMYPPKDTELGIEIPLFMAETPNPVTIKGMTRDCLELIGDPIPNKGSQPQLNRRLIGLIKSCEMIFIAFDDFHHLFDPTNQAVAYDVSEWLKVLIKETRKTFIVTGIEGTVNKIWKVNKQLARLFFIRETIKPFAWSNGEKEKDIEIQQDFINLVLSLTKLEKTTLPKMTNPFELHRRLHFSCDGIVGYLADLIRYASELAKEKSENELTIDILSQAFNDVLAPRLEDKTNPFTTSLSNEFVPPPKVTSNNEKPQNIRISSKR